MDVCTIAFHKTNPSLCVFTALMRPSSCTHVCLMNRTSFHRTQVTHQIVPLDPVTIPPQAGWAVTPASDSTGQSECYRAGSRWPSWCHTDSQIGFNCQGCWLSQWLCGGQGTPWVAVPKIEEHCDLTHFIGHAQRIFFSCSRTQGHKTCTIKDSSRLHAAAKKVDFTQVLSLFLSASLTHCLHRKTVYTLSHKQTLSSLGYDSSQWQSCVWYSDVSGSQCMSRPIFFPMYSHSTRLLSDQICCAVTAFSLLYVHAFVVRGRHCRLPMCFIFFWTLAGFNKCNYCPPLYSSVSIVWTG